MSCGEYKLISDGIFSKISSLLIIQLLGSKDLIMLPKVLSNLSIQLLISICFFSADFLAEILSNSSI